MYSRISNQSYRDAPYIEQFTCCPNYIYTSVADFAKFKVRENLQEQPAWCRTIGILHSIYGNLYVCDMNSSGGIASDKIQISFMYLKSPKSTAILQSLVTPSPVQIFGMIQWHCKKPVVFVKLMQVLTVPRAIQMKDVMDQLIDLKSQSVYCT